MNTNHKVDSPTARAMDEAIELNIEGRSPYPDRATFIDADAPYVGAEIRRAVDQGYAIVLVEADGSTLTLGAKPAKRAPGLARIPSRLSAGMSAVSQTLSARVRATPRS